MKNKLLILFKNKIEHQGLYSNEIHIVDYTERTNSKEAVNAHCIKPKNIDSLKIVNPLKVHVTVSIFKPQCFMGADGKELKQCECVIYPTAYTNNSWVLFVEIKDCKPKNAANYHKEAKEKIFENVQLFRSKHIIEETKVVYAVVSFPRKAKTNFHNHLIKASEWKQIRETHKIMIKGTNEITVKNLTSVS